jgi:hypothetical protein
MAKIHLASKPAVKASAINLSTALGVIAFASTPGAHRSPGPGTDVMIFKIFSPQKIGVFDSKQS